MIVPLAHVGHWLVSVSYFLPVLALGGWLGIGWLRSRGRPDAAAEELGEGAPPGPAERPAAP